MNIFNKKKLDYKPIAGIYIIRNILNKKIYIGSSKDILKRWGQHKKDLMLGKHHNRFMQHEFDFYDRMPELFEFKVLKIYSGFLSKKLLHVIEKWYIDRYKDFNFMYNEGTPARINNFKSAIVFFINLID